MGVPGTVQYTKLLKLGNYQKKLRQNWQTTRDLAIETKLSSKSQKSKRLIQQLKENYANLFLENLTADQSTN